MLFFNQTASDYLQFISMVLEIIGISLAYIEIRYKPLAQKIEKKIIFEENRIRNIAYKIIQNQFFSVLVTIFIIVVFFIAAPYMAGFFDRVIPQNWNDYKVTILWIIMPIIILFITSIFFISFAGFVTWLNQFSEGHAIGALGVVVTLIGLLGQTYQVITIMIT